MREECLTCKKVSYENSKFYDNNNGVKIIMHVVDALGICDDEGGTRLP